MQIAVMHPPHALRFWPLQITGWLAFGVAMGLSRVSSYPLDYMLATKGVLALLGLITSLALRALYRRVLRRELPLPLVIVLLVVSSYLAALPWTAAYNVLDDRILEALTGRAIPPGSAFGGALYHAFVLVAWSVLYLGVRQYAEIQAGRERLLRAESLANEARLSALRYQLNPHFLYNTLNAISTLVIDNRGYDATRMIARLSDLLRVTLNDAAPEEVPLSDEIDVLQKYLDIEQVRFGDRLDVRIAIDPAVCRARVPALILQPPVENAIRHGISVRESGGIIEVRAVRVANNLVLTVDDDGGGISATTNADRSGIGLANCRARLEARYGDRQRMAIDTSPLGGVRVTMEIPFHAVEAGSAEHNSRSAKS